MLSYPTARVEYFWGEQPRARVELGLDRRTKSQGPQPGMSNGSGQRWLGRSTFACLSREKRGGIGKRIATGNNKCQDGGKKLETEIIAMTSRSVMICGIGSISSYQRKACHPVGTTENLTIAKIISDGNGENISSLLQKWLAKLSVLHLDDSRMGLLTGC